jgi:DNA modification methylase
LEHKVESNKLHFLDTNVHNWYRFVLSFPPHLVRKYLNRFNASKDTLVLDPFCGTGTTLVECKKNNIPSIGLEANPIALLASKVKINWRIEPYKIIEVSKIIAEKALNNINKYKNNYLKLNEAQDKLIIKNSISQLPLHKSLVLLEAINEFKENGNYNHLRLAFAKQLVNSYSNLHFGPEVGVSRIKKDDMDVVGLWLSEVVVIAHDIALFNEHKNIYSEAFFTDSRNINNLDKKIDIIFTSPPYPNEKDYTRTTRLESVLLGYISNKEDLKKYKKNLLRSNTRNIYIADDDEKYIKYNKKIINLSKEIEEKRIMLGKTSGFEKYYHRVVELYFGGIYQHLKTLKKSLNHGAYLAYVVGDQASYFQILINTGNILAEIAEDIGYKVEAIDIFRTRFSTTSKKYLNEEVVILRNI